MSFGLDQEVLDLFNPLGHTIASYMSDVEVDLANRAFIYAAKHHHGQYRSSGEHYITHPVAVAKFLADWCMDIDSILAALLHDLIEDTAVTKADITEEFGEVVANLVDGVSKLTQVSFNSRMEAQAENFRKMLMALAKDLRVILVKLADRLHNMRTLGSLSVDRRRRIARETLEIFAPIANRIGMYGVAVELEDLGFSALYPDRYRIIKSLVEKVHGRHSNILSEIKMKLQQRLNEVGVNVVSINSRAKNPYSIYCKMKNNDLSFSDITDVYAIRVITDSIDGCYRALGVAHSLFKPVPGRFKDYIALSKANGYQSLHTVLFGPYGVPIEVQLRTVKMDDTANNGVAAHWQYKSVSQSNNNNLRQVRNWVQSLVDIQQNTFNSLEFLENVKVNLFPDEVYVFSPKGDIFALPAGSTALDFAYAVHTDIGNTCASVKVNRQMAALSTVLSSGHTVEVVNSVAVKPCEFWLDFVKTAKAKSSIRNFLKQEKQVQALSLGRKLLESAMKTYNLELQDLDLYINSDLLDKLSIGCLDDLLEEIGIGKRSAKLVAYQIINSENINSKLDDISSSELMIAGTEGVVVQFADCCYPLPGDPIIGKMISNAGIIIHHAGCEQIFKSSLNDCEQQIAVCWDNYVDGDYLVEIRVDIKNDKGVLATLALAVADAHSSISDIKILKFDDVNARIILEIYVKDRKNLASVIRKIKRLPAINKVVRGGDLMKNLRRYKYLG